MDFWFSLNTWISDLLRYSDFQLASLQTCGRPCASQPEQHKQSRCSGGDDDDDDDDDDGVDDSDNNMKMVMEMINDYG